MDVSIVSCSAYDSTSPKVEALPRCSTARTAAAKAAMAPKVSSRTLSHLQMHADVCFMDSRSEARAQRSKLVQQLICA